MRTGNYPNKMQSSGSSQEKTCTVCHGTGKRKTKAGQEVECYACRGTGKTIGSYSTK